MPKQGKAGCKTCPSLWCFELLLMLQALNSQLSAACRMNNLRSLTGSGWGRILICSEPRGKCVQELLFPQRAAILSVTVPCVSLDLPTRFPLPITGVAGGLIPCCLQSGL